VEIDRHAEDACARRQPQGKLSNRVIGSCGGRFAAMLLSCWRLNMAQSLRRLAVFALFVVLSFAAIASSNAKADEPNPPSRNIEGHPRTVLSVNFTPDGKGLVSSSRDKTIKVWDLATGNLKRTLTDHKDGVYVVTFSHDGKLMASGSADKKIILWDASRFEPIRTLEGQPARDVAFSPDDKTLASAGEDGTFRLWDVAAGTPKVTRREHTAAVKSVVYFPDGNTIATASSDKTVRLWDARSGEPKQVLKGHTAVVEFCAVSPDGKQLMSGTGNIGELIFWKAQTGEIEKVLPNAHGDGHDAEIDCGRYSPNGKWAVSGSKDRTDKFWDPRTFEQIHIIKGNPGRTECMCFSADGKTLVTGYALDKMSHITVWDLSEWNK
jgi:WD40 repeat protein